jgi:tetratricopeptide (TPR) repeat protein
MLSLWKCLAGLFFFCFLPHCTSTPPSSLPPSASDLNLLGQAYLCQTKTDAQKSWLQPGSRETPWGNGTEHFQEIVIPTTQGQWIVFNTDEIIVGVITVFPDGLSLEDYPTLKQTLSQLPSSREFYLTSSELLEGHVPDSVTLYRTGKATTTHQYYIRHRPGQDDQLVMAVFVLDPYESLLDGGHQKFLSYLKKTSSPQKSKPFSSPSSSTGKDFLGLQQFARGEISLFASCGTKNPDIAQDAYHKAIQYGLSDTKQRAEAHHRLGLAFIQLDKIPEATASIEAALEIQPPAANILNSYGTVLVQLKKIPEGIQAYEQALALQPAYAQARFNLAEVLESTNPKRALQEYETFLVLVENHPGQAAKAAIAETKIKALQGQ